MICYVYSIYTYMYVCVYIYIYIQRERERYVTAARRPWRAPARPATTAGSSWHAGPSDTNSTTTTNTTIIIIISTTTNNNHITINTMNGQ